MNNVKTKKTTDKKNLYQVYKTPDIYIASFLKSHGVILKGTERENNRVIFIFQNRGNIQGLINKYFNDSSVRVLTFKAALRDLRSIIFGYKNSILTKEN